MSWKIMEKYRNLTAGETPLARGAKGGQLRIAMGYPNTYFLGMSSLGMQTIFGRLLATPGISCERVFLPEPEDAAELAAAGKPLFSLETQTPLGEFDVLGFTCSYELDFPNLVQILKLANIPHRTAHRDEGHPIVLVGGPIASLNPEPLAEFVDAFAVGEGEEVLGEIVETLKATRGLPRSEVHRALAAIHGVYVPSLYEVTYHPSGPIAAITPKEGAPSTIGKRVVKPLDFPTVSAVLTPDTEFANTFLMELSRGCPGFCRFCVVSYGYNPLRWRSPEDILQAAKPALVHTKRVGLVSATASDHPQIDEICTKFLEQEARVSFSSLRTETLTRTMVDTIVAGGQRTLTLAPETADEALRRAINKRYGNDRVMEVTEMAARAGIQTQRLYFMLGLPEAPEDEGESLLELLANIRAMQEKMGVPLGSVTASISQFVPKPTTPLQWAPQLSTREAQRRLDRVRTMARRYSGVKVNFESPKWAYIEGLLSRGDRRLAPVIEAVAGQSSFAAWQRAWRAAGIDPDFFVTRERPQTEMLPWAHLKNTWTPEMLQRDLGRFAQVLAGRPAGPPPKRMGPIPDAVVVRG